jgi:O-antigen ligase
MNSDVARALPDREWFGAVCPPVLVSLPFLFPFVGGPSASVWQLLASWSCAALLLVLSDVALPARRVMVGLGLVAGAIALSPSSDWTPKLSTCVALAVIAASAAAGAGLVRSTIAAHRALALGLLGVGIVSAVLGLLQYYQLAEPLVPWTTAPELGLAYGNLRQRNQFATLISMALIAGLWLYASSDAPNVRRALGGAALLLVLAVAASTSRTGLLQWLIVLGVAAWMAWRERRQQRNGMAHTSRETAWRLPHPLALLALIPCYFAASWVLPMLAGGNVQGMLSRLSEGDPTGQGRKVLWRNVIELIGQHPWRGWGWGELSFAHYSHLYSGPRFVEIPDNAHNLPLHLAVELGVPAALLVAGGLTWMVMAAQPWRERDPTRLMAWGLLGVIGVHSLLEYPLWFGPFQLAFGLCLGLLWPGKVRKQSARTRNLVTALPALALMTAVGYAAWDYNRISQIYLSSDERLPAYRDDTFAKLQGSWLYANTVRFAGLTLMPVTRANAPEVHALAERAMHFSPEPRVIVKLIESAQLMGLNDEAVAQAVHFERAFPEEYAKWLVGKPVAR